MLMSNINEFVFSYRIFEIEERWTDERTLAHCMSNGGYINEYVMNSLIKMILFEQKIKDMHGEKIGFLKHMTFSEISVHVPCTISKQWFLVVANFMDKCFDVLNPSHNTNLISDTDDAVVHNFKELFSVAYPHTPNFKICDFKIRHVNVPKQNFKFDSGFFIFLFMQFYNGMEVPIVSNDDLPGIKRKFLYQLVTNKYNTAKQSIRIKNFIAKHVPICW